MPVTVIQTIAVQSRIKQSNIAQTLTAKARIQPQDKGFFKLRSQQQNWPITLDDKRIL